MTFYRLLLIVFFIFLSACFSPLKQIKDPNKPMERESYSLMPPAGDGWRYVQQKQANGHILTFSKQGISPSHTLTAIVIEFQGNTSFNSPEYFLDYIKEMKEADMDPWSYKIIQKNWVLDNRFGDYSVHYYTVFEDTDIYSMKPNEVILSKISGYAIIHPYVNNLIIDILFSEQGKPAEVNPQFEQEAIKFIEGLHLKKKE